MKARLVVDSRKQRSDDEPMDAASPTVTNKSVLITGVIDTEEGRDIAKLDLLGAYLWDQQDQIIHMLLKGKIAELMVLAAPKIY